MKKNHNPQKMIEKVNAIVLRISPFSMTSHVVTWLTENGMILRTVIKGATRSKSTFLGQYDLFYTCEVLYYHTRGSREVYIAKECTPLKLRESFRSNWRCTQCASWFSFLIQYTAGSYNYNSDIFNLLEETLDFIHTQKYTYPIVFARFETQLLNEIGIFPNFDKCMLCNNSGLKFDISEGRMHCPQHSYKDSRSPIVTISNDVIGLMETLSKSVSIGPQSSILKTSETTTFSLLRFLGLFMRYHIESLPIEGRAIALKAITDLVNEKG